MRTRTRWMTISLFGVMLAGCGMEGPDGDLTTPDETRREALKKCTMDDCDPPGGDGDPPDNTPPPPLPQPKPPAPYGTPNKFGYTGLPGLAFGVDAAISARLSAPPAADNVPWPLPGMPYVPEIATAPVRVDSIDTNLWAFTSYDAGGMALLCAAACSTPPAILFNPNYGTYQATLRMSPRLDVEFWEIGATFTPSGGLVIYPHRVAEVTATIHTRGFAECVGWERGSGRLHAAAGADDVTIARDTGVLEDVADFFVPGYTAAINRKIRDRLLALTGVGHFEPLPGDAGPCATLGVSGDAFSGAFTWNETPAPVRFPVTSVGLTTKTLAP